MRLGLAALLGRAEAPGWEGSARDRAGRPERSGARRGCGHLGVWGSAFLSVPVAWSAASAGGRVEPGCVLPPSFSQVAVLTAFFVVGCSLLD